MTAGAAVLALAACQENSDLATATVNDPVGAAQGVPTLASADADMASVLAALSALGPKPIEELSPEEARRQPTLGDAVEKVQRDHGRDPRPPRVQDLENVTIQGLGGAIPARIYTPAGSGPFPVIVYYHGGGGGRAEAQGARATQGGLSKPRWRNAGRHHRRPGSRRGLPATPSRTLLDVT